MSDPVISVTAGESASLAEVVRHAERGGVARRSDKVAQDVLSVILDNGIPDGAMLPPEREMRAQLNVGRPSLREGLRLLEMHGIIRVKPGANGGPVVASVSPADMGRLATFYFQAFGVPLAELIEARRQIEPAVARLAARTAPGDTAKILGDVLDRGDSAIEQGNSAWNRTAMDFHFTVAKLTCNPILYMYVGALHEIQSDRVRSVFPTSQRADVNRIHRLLAEAIIDADEDKAERLMARHVEEDGNEIRRLFPGMLDETIDWR